MKIKKIGILKEKDVRDETMLDTFKVYGTSCFCSDLARLTGVSYNQASGYGEYWVDGTHIINSKKNKTNISNMNFYNNSGTLSSTLKTSCKSGVRIAISFDDIVDFNLNELRDLKMTYPLRIIGGSFGETLDNLFESKSKFIVLTGRKHDILGEQYDEYEVFGIKFIKMKNKKQSGVLSDGTISEANAKIYLAIENISLIIDEKAKIAYSSIILFGSNFDSNNRPFEESDLNEYLNNGFLKSITDSLDHTKPKILYENEQEIKNETRISNRYKFDFTTLSEEEIIEICINSNIAVFLHGETGVGKTERMLALDKNLELVDFGCTSSDGFTGIIAKDFNSKELFLYEPYWYKSLCEKCKNEPDKLHILFLEELTNAKNDVQKVAFEVTLNKTLTNSGFRLKLPKNAVVCAAGNEASESRSANKLSAPLFGRFAHVYIDTNSSEWLKWALKRKKEEKKLIYKDHEPIDKIHPAIIDYIQVNGDKVLRTPYDGENPNADPRKWALASKALYESNNPHVLRAFVGESITQDFIKFSQMNLISISDVLNDKVDVNDIPFDPSLRWKITMCLSVVDDENVDKVRDFVSKLGKEFLAVFNYEWSKDNAERIMKLYSQSENQLVKSLVPNGNK